MADLAERYTAFYAARTAEHVYSVEFVVRAYLGRYPRLQVDRALYAGARVLDIGFGDGRNVPLLAHLGMTVFRVEISEEICTQTEARLARLGIAADLRVGRNRALPFEDAFFDHVLACHACYYVDPGSTFSDNMREIARVLRPGGRLVFSAPIGTSYILRGGRDHGDGHVTIAEDPYGVRNGIVMRKFDESVVCENGAGTYAARPFTVKC